MALSEETKKSLVAAVGAGARDCAARLGKVTRKEWTVGDVALSLDEAGPFGDLLASVANDHYGAHLTFPGGSFLVVCSGKDGYYLASAFTRGVSDRVDALHKWEAPAFGEVSSIALNPMLDRVAEAWGQDLLILSAPQAEIASQRDHLARALSRYRAGSPLDAAFLVKMSAPGHECLLVLFLDREFVGRITARG